MTQADHRDITKMEAYFKEKAQEFGTADLDDLILKLSLEKSFDPRNKILAVQVCQMEKAWYDEIMRSNQTEEELNASITEL